MRSTLLWGIVCLLTLSSATIEFSNDPTSSKFTTLVFFTLIFILYYLTLAIGIIKTGRIRISGVLSLLILSVLGVMYILSGYTFTYFFYPIIVIALILYLCSGILFIVALKDFFQENIKNSNIKYYKSQIFLSIIISLLLSLVLYLIPLMRTSSIAIGIFAIFLVVLLITCKNKIDHDATILVLTFCFILSVLIINVNISNVTFTEKRAYKILSLVVLAFSWGWSSDRIINRFLHQKSKESSSLIFLAFSFVALGFYQVLIAKTGESDAWSTIIAYRNIILVIGIIIGWVLAFREKPKSPRLGL